MSEISTSAANWLRPLARRTLPLAARLWIRNEIERASETKQDLYDRFIVREQVFTNRECLRNFNFRLTTNAKREGVSAMVRVRDEESKIYYALKSIYDIFDEIVLVDNASTDRTLNIARKFKAEEDQADKIKLYSYPFKLARCGDEHHDTPEDSIYSIAYYTNWALSQCSRRYICKWDGDMVLRKEVRESFKRFLGQIQTGRKCGWVIYGQTIYRDAQRQYYLANGEINGEIEIFPNRMSTRFRKVDVFELLSSNPPLREGRFPV